MARRQRVSGFPGMDERRALIQQLQERANGPYERQRIQYALDMKKAVDTYRRLDDPSAEAERQEKLDVQNRLETQAKRQENKREQAPAAEINLH